MVEHRLELSPTQPLYARGANGDGHGHTEFGAFPKDWQRMPISALGKVVTGNTPPTKDAANYLGGKIPFLAPGDIKHGTWIKRTDKLITEYGLQQSRPIRHGATCFVCIGSTIGKVGYVTAPICATNQQINSILPRPDFDPLFVFYLLMFWADHIRNQASPSPVPILSKGTFEQIQIWGCADLDQQRDIARSLQQINDALSLQDDQIRATERLKSAAMQALFTLGLRGGVQKETEFGLVPEKWASTPLDDVATIQTGVAKGRKLSNADMVPVPYLRVANVQDGHLDLGEMKEIRIRRSEVDRYRLQFGDVVLTEGGDFDKLGRGFIWRGELELCVHQNHVFAVRPDSARLLPEFFAYLAQSAYGKAYFLKVAHKTTNLACINSTKLKAFPALVPPTLDEQQEIVNILNALDRKMDIHKRKRAVLDDLFNALLAKLMTGEIRVADLDLTALTSVPVEAAA